MTDIPKKVNFFKSIKLRAWIGIFLLSFLPLFFLGLYSFDALDEISRDVLVEGNIQAFQQVKYEVDQYVSSFRDLTNFVAADERFKNIESREQAVEAMRHLDQSYEGIERIVLVDAAGHLLAHSKRENEAITELTFTENSLAKSNKSFMFAPEAFLVKAKLNDSPDSDAIIATISFLQLRKSLEGITVGTKFRYFLVTDSGENILEQPDFPKDVIADLLEKPCGAYDLLPESGDVSPQIAISLPILHYGLKIFVFQDAGEVYGVARRLGRKIFNFVLLLALASFVLAIYFSWTITGPVAAIADKANELSEGKYDVSVDINRDDELGFLAKCFNNMSYRISRKITEVSALYKVTNYINSSSTSRKALDLCLEHLVDIFKAKRGSIMLLNEERTSLYVESFKIADDAKLEQTTDAPTNDKTETAKDNDEPVHRFELKVGEGIAGKVAATNEAILCMDCGNDDRFKEYSDEKSTKTLVSVPLSFQNRMIGVINLSDRSDSQPFTNEDLELLQAIANQMAMSIDNARLHDLSVIDEQTSLYVRKFLEIRLEDEIKRSKRFGFPLTIAMFSIDGFAELNAKNGKHACEAALYELGRLLKKTVRATDIPAEYDTNKFCAILAHTTDGQAKLFTDRFLDTVKNFAIKRDDRSFSVTISAGICQFGHDATDFATMLDRADKALSESRKKGNVSIIYGDSKEQKNV